METQVKLTELEKQVLNAIINSEYQYDKDSVINNPIWFIEEQDVDMSKGQLSGVVSSCVKKEYVGINKDGSDSTIWITKKGFDAIKEDHIKK